MNARVALRASFDECGDDFFLATVFVQQLNNVHQYNQITLVWLSTKYYRAEGPTTAAVKSFLSGPAGSNTNTYLISQLLL